MCIQHRSVCVTVHDEAPCVHRCGVLLPLISAVLSVCVVDAVKSVSYSSVSFIVVSCRIYDL